MPEYPNIQALAKAVNVRLETFVQEVLNDVAETVVMRTPVDTGFLRGSWFASLDGPQGGSSVKDPGGAATLGRMSVSLNGVKPGDKVWFVNQANYAYHVENGTSRMAPRGFVKSTINDVPLIIRRTAQKLANR